PIFFRRSEIHRNSSVQRPPRCTLIVGKKQPSAGESDKYSLRVQRIHLYRMTFGTIGSPRCEVVAPFGQHRVIVESRQAVPCNSIIFTSEEPDWARSGKPDSGLSRMAWCEKKDMIERQSIAAAIIGVQGRVCIVIFWAESWRFCRFLPCPPSVGRAVN